MVAFSIFKALFYTRLHGALVTVCVCVQQSDFVKAVVAWIVLNLYTE